MSVLHAFVVIVVASWVYIAGCSSPEAGVVVTHQAGEFVVKGAQDLKDHYGDYDVDCVLGSYRMPQQLSRKQLLLEVQENAVATGWQIVGCRNGVCEYHRYRELGVFPSFEVVRLGFSVDSRVVVGWLQMDGPRTADQAERSGQWEWADDHLWPRFEALALP